MNQESILHAKNRAVDTLIQILEEGNEAHRCCAAQALGSIGDLRAVNPLMDHAQDSDLDVALDSIDALGKLGDPACLPLLLEGFHLADMPDIKVSAIESVGHLGGAAVVEVLIQALRADFDMVDTSGWDASWDINRIAVESLGRIGDPRAVAPLTSMLDDDDVVVDEGNILSALVHCQEQGVAKVSHRMHHHKLARSRRRAALALGEVNTEAAKNALADALLDDDGDVRIYAARSLAGFADKSYLIPMFMLLKDQSAEVRREAVELVAELGGERAADRLIASLDDEDVDVQIAATAALGQLHSSNAVDALIEKLDSSDANMRASAVEALGSIGDRRASPALQAMLKDAKELEKVRAAIPAALVAMMDDEVIATLRAGVGDEDRVLRSMTMMALRDIGTEAARDVLLAALQGELLAPPDEENLVDTTDEEGHLEVVEDDDSGSSPESNSTEGLEDVVEHGPMSTLESIARDNAAIAGAAPGAGTEDPDQKLPDEVREFVSIAEKNWQDIQSFKVKVPAPHLDVRYFAARALASFADAEVVTALCACVQEVDLDLDLQVEAVNTLGRIGDDRAFAQLLPLLDHESQTLRFATTRALGQLQTEKVRKVLIEKLDDEDHFVRLAAAEGLGQFQQEEARSALRVHLLADKALGVRLACAKSLRAYDNEEDVDVLVQAAFLDGGEQRLEIGAMLRLFYPDRATDQFIAILNDPQQTFVHRVAIDALQEIHRSDMTA